jgi:hypothetical protein
MAVGQDCVALARMILNPNCEVNVTTVYKLVAASHLLPAGDFKGHLETVTFIAANETESHKWWAVNVGTFEKDFTRIVSPELAENIARRLRQGEIVEFPNRYELADVKGKFGGCFMD